MEQRDDTIWNGRRAQQRLAQGIAAVLVVGAPAVAQSQPVLTLVDSSCTKNPKTLERDYSNYNTADGDQYAVGQIVEQTVAAPWAPAGCSYTCPPGFTLAGPNICRQGNEYISGWAVYRVDRCFDALYDSLNGCHVSEDIFIALEETNFHDGCWESAPGYCSGITITKVFTQTGSYNYINGWFYEGYHSTAADSYREPAWFDLHPSVASLVPVNRYFYVLVARNAAGASRPSPRWHTLGARTRSVVPGTTIISP